MAQNGFDRKTYNQEYYQAHKEQLNQRKVKRNSLSWFKGWTLEELIHYDENDKSPENILWYNQIITYAKLITVLRHARAREEDKEKLDLEWIMKIPTKGPRLPPVAAICSGEWNTSGEATDASRVGTANSGVSVGRL